MAFLNEKMTYFYWRYNVCRSVVFGQVFHCFNTPLARAWWVGYVSKFRCKYVVQTTHDNPLNRQSSLHFSSPCELQSACYGR